MGKSLKNADVKLLSIVVPVFNEEEGLAIFFKSLDACLSAIPFQKEIILIDDGSTDDSLKIIQEKIQKSDDYRCLVLTRNFGHQNAITAGLNHANGDMIITMDADLQDPPELIPKFIEEWQSGAKVVFGRRRLRKDNWLKRISAKWYYYLLYKFSEIKIKGNIADYRLIDKQVLDELKQIKEKSKYLRGLISWMGYPYAIVDYDRPNRTQGKTKFSFYKMLRLAMDGILNFSLVPLRLGLVLGVISVILGISFLIYIIFDTLIFDKIYPLYKWISVVTFIFIGFLFVLIWILAEYIGMLLDQGKTRPSYVIKQSLNFTNKAE